MKLRIIGFGLLLSILAGCATWTYDGRNYNSSMEAIEAARQDVRRKVAEVNEREAPLAGSVLILTPSVSWSRQAVVVTGAATEEIIQYIATVLYYGFYGMAESVQRRNIFRETSIQEFSQRDPLGNAQYDYLIWLRLDGPDSAQWMISPGKDTSAARSLYHSPTSDPGDRMARFVESVERHVQQAQK